MSGSQEKEAITWYRVSSGFFAKDRIYLNHEGIYIPRWLVSDIDVPYAAITECNYIQDHCIIEYVSEKGKHEKIGLYSRIDDPISALKACYSILFISRKQGYDIRKQLDRNFSKFIFLLDNIGVNPELIEHEDVDIESSFSHWKRKLGTLGLKNSVIQSVEVVESGYGEIIEVHSTSTTSSGSIHGSPSTPTTTSHKELVFHRTYHFDFTTNAEPISLFESDGNPRKVLDRGIIGSGIGMLLYSFILLFTYPHSYSSRSLFPSISLILAGLWLGGILLLSRGLKFRKVIDYTWKGGGLAERLIQDNKLTEMLKKANAPALRIRRNYIQMEDKEMPDKKLFWCIERIAGHLCEIREVRCPNCGGILPSDSNLCRRCGHDLYYRRFDQEKLDKDKKEILITKFTEFPLILVEIGFFLGVASYCINMVSRSWSIVEGFPGILIFLSLCTVYPVYIALVSWLSKSPLTGGLCGLSLMMGMFLTWASTWGFKFSYFDEVLFIFLIPTAVYSAIGGFLGYYFRRKMVKKTHFYLIVITLLALTSLIWRALFQSVVII
jgi:hypothetical protein